MSGKWPTNNGTAEPPKGEQIERKAQQWLVEKGLHSIECNYRCRQGEIDIVMLDQLWLHTMLTQKQLLL